MRIKNFTPALLIIALLFQTGTASFDDELRKDYLIKYAYNETDTVKCKSFF